MVAQFPRFFSIFAAATFVITVSTSVIPLKKYSTVNNLVGWVVFVVAAVVYCLTVEPTASFWDCPEFITTGYKLEVGHPPGAPFFMLVANLFTQLTSDVSRIALMVNLMSALMSAACILFLFWSITHLVRRLLTEEGEELTTPRLIAVMGSGVVGALVYTFSDTFWFSAVEGEVYAFSSLFTAVVFWLILKWEDVADQPHSDRWLVLIAYLIGLSVGVHLLNLLCLPAVVLVYYYRKTPDANLRGSLLALVGSAVLVAIVLYGIVPGIVKVGGWFELLFVNVMGLPFNSGVLAYVVVLAAVLIWAAYETYEGRSRGRMALSFVLTVALLGIPFYGHGGSSVVIGVIVLLLLIGYLRPQFQDKLKAGWRVSARVLNTSLLCVLLIVIGYSSYALIVIRSTANTPMDQNSPEDIFTLGEYLSREQYGTRPLFYGPAYSSEVALKVNEQGGYCEARVKSRTTKYIRKDKTEEGEKDSYIGVPGRTEYAYAQNMFFPRMYSSAHKDYYESWMEIKGHQVPFDKCGNQIMVTLPTQWENLRFFFSYQLNWMYWRYFLWNFVGRQNDRQGGGEIENGNWVTGFKFIDNLLVGNQDTMPSDLKNNKGHNVYYGLPLLLGIIGLLWQAYRGKRGIQQFWVVFFLFFMTGIAIVLYLNQTPNQPRERDYAYAGSFYAFAIWVGMGVAALTRWVQLRLRRWKPEGQAAQCVIPLVVFLVCLLVPIQMGSQNWDDHDRSHRYLCSDFGKNYLMSTQEEGNPIIFTNGDNDTFPLWYNQEVEEFRTDARVCNLSYVQTDWYIDQMVRPAYDSPSLPIDWPRTAYATGTNDFIYVEPSFMAAIDELYSSAREKLANGDTAGYLKVVNTYGEDPYELKNILKYWVLNTKGGDLHVIPTDSIVVHVDKDAVRRSGMMIINDSIPDIMHISLKGKRLLYKNELMMLQLLSATNWERPLYIAISVGPENQLGLDNHFIQEGLAYRFTPYDKNQTGVVLDANRMYDNLMNKFSFGGLDYPGIYIDENAMRMCYTHRRLFARVASQFIEQGDTVRARQLLERCEEVLPVYNVPYDWQSGAPVMGETYYRMGDIERGDAIVKAIADNEFEYLQWYLSLDERKFVYCLEEVEYHIAVAEHEVNDMANYSSPLAKDYRAELDLLYSLYVERLKK